MCRTLGALAEKCHAFAKALHYKEIEFQDSPATAVEALISINNHLRQPEAAVGVLTVAQRTLNVELKVRSPVPSLQARHLASSPLLWAAWCTGHKCWPENLSGALNAGAAETGVVVREAASV